MGATPTAAPRPVPPRAIRGSPTSDRGCEAFVRPRAHESLDTRPPAAKPRTHADPEDARPRHGRYVAGMTDDVTHYDAVEAYCTTLSCLPGDDVGLHVWCSTDRYDVAVRRWTADPHGDARSAPSCGRRPDWQAPTRHPPSADADGCGWPESTQIPVGDDWRSGVYLVTLTAHGAPAGAHVGHALLVVRHPPDGVDAAGAGHQHLQRLQQLGWPQPLHRRAPGQLRPAVRSRHARASALR